MLYRAIGLMSGSSLDGLDIAFAEFHEQGGKWSYEILHADCYAYSEEWSQKLKHATSLGARDYQLLHAAYGHYTGQLVNNFIEKHGLNYRVSLIASHGHTTFHEPSRKMTAQLGDGAAIAAVTGLPVVSDLRAMDVALGGQGAPIVPIGARSLLTGYDYFLNIGGIANITMHGEKYTAFDICPANRVMNLLASVAGKTYDEDGHIAESGYANTGLLEKLNSLDYYSQPPPKSLANEFGTETLYPLISSSGLDVKDAMRTMVDHIIDQVSAAIDRLPGKPLQGRLLATGGGALNKFLIRSLSDRLQQQGIEVIVPDENLINYKEALIMAFIGVLRWRQEYNVLSSVTGATRDSIGGALWTGQEA